MESELLSISGAIAAGASVVMAFIAYSALRTWKHQDRAKREAEFLDQLIESVHAYIAELPRAITLLEMSRFGMESHIPTWKKDASDAKELEGAMIYIAKHGDEDAQRINTALRVLKPLAARVMSLGAKGQVLKLDDHPLCFEAIRNLIGQSDIISSFAVVIGSTNLNWEHPEVADRLKWAMAISPIDIRQHINDSNVVILGFAQKNYKQIYG